MRINVVTSLNDSYTKYACVMLTSLLATQKTEHEIHIYLLHASLTEENKTHLRNTVQSYNGNLHFVSVDETPFREFRTSAQWSYEAFFRLMLVDILPPGVDRLLYLDVDTIVNKPIDEMYFCDFGDTEIFGQTDTNQPPFGDFRDQLFSEWISSNTLTYCCSGVTLWNLEKMRGKYTFETYLELAKKLQFAMVAPDQDLLNFVHQEYLQAWEDPAKYGVFAKYAYNCDVHYEEIKNYSAIIHFAGQKPWHGEFIHYDTEKLWWEYAKLTPFYYEFLEDFLISACSSSLIYDTLSQSLHDKEQLQTQLQESVALNQKLLGMLQK